MGNECLNTESAMDFRSEDIQRFLRKVAKSDGCWQWLASLRGKTGYGAFKIGGKVMDAHRISYMIHKGAIPLGMLVCHECDNRQCVNPEHLWLGTYSDNRKDALNKGRAIIPKHENLQKHPSLSAYRKGCRCDGCRLIKRLSDKEYKLKRMSECRHSGQSSS